MDNNLFLYRRRANLRQLDLANKVGLSEQAISKYERGRAKPPIKTAIAIAKILGVDVKKVFPDIQETVKK